MASTETAYCTIVQVVVFGGNGFVGSNVCRILSGMGKKVAAINRSGSAPSTDLCNQEAMAGFDVMLVATRCPEEEGELDGWC